MTRVPASAPRCGAKTRAGKPCQAPPGPAGNGRCKLHGGASGIGSQSPLGVYAEVMAPEEVAAAARMELGTLISEIALVKVHIRRVEKARQVYDECVASGETPTKSLVQTRLGIRRVRKQDVEGGETSEDVEESAMERPDFEALIDRFTGRVERLERTEAMLNGTISAGGGAGNGEDGGVRQVNVTVTGGLPDKKVVVDPPDAAPTS